MALHCFAGGISFFNSIQVIRCLCISGWQNTSVVGSIPSQRAAANATVKSPQSDVPCWCLFIHVSQRDSILLCVEDRSNLLREAVCTAFLPTMKHVHRSLSTANVRYGQPVTVACPCFQHLLCHIGETIISCFGYDSQHHMPHPGYGHYYAFSFVFWHPCGKLVSSVSFSGVLTSMVSIILSLLLVSAILLVSTILLIPCCNLSVIVTRLYTSIPLLIFAPGVPTELGEICLC